MTAKRLAEILGLAIAKADLQMINVDSEQINSDRVHHPVPHHSIVVCILRESECFGVYIKKSLNVYEWSVSGLVYKQNSILVLLKIIIPILRASQCHVIICSPLLIIFQQLKK